MMPIYFWLACVVCSLGGTVFYFRTARHRPSQDAERFGLLLLYLFTGLVTAAVGVWCWFAWWAWQGFGPH
jgi:hypothetical protein